MMKEKYRNYVIPIVIFVIFFTIQIIYICIIVNSEFFRFIYIENILLGYLIGFSIKKIIDKGKCEKCQNRN